MFADFLIIKQSINIEYFKNINIKLLMQEPIVKIQNRVFRVLEIFRRSFDLGYLNERRIKDEITICYCSPIHKICIENFKN